MSRVRAMASLASCIALLAACSSTPTTDHPSAGRLGSAASSRTSTDLTPAAPTSTTPHSAAPAPSAPAHPRTHRERPAGERLPLPYRTGSARQVLTVVAASPTTVRARLQTWRKVGGSWHRVGAPVPAWLGAAGFSEPASEQSTATPTGSYTLTRAFGALPDPGTALPYRHTTPADWWISQPGPLYNTLQHCTANCPFTQGAPNEHLRFELPYYDYAVVIDYNTANAPGGVVPGRGSAFFLHVTVHQPTQGCVSVPRAALVRILRWLRPSRHPRILLGVRRV